MSIGKSLAFASAPASSTASTFAVSFSLMAVIKARSNGFCLSCRYASHTIALTRINGHIPRKSRADFLVRSSFIFMFNLPLSHAPGFTKASTILPQLEPLLLFTPFGGEMVVYTYFCRTGLRIDWLKRLYSPICAHLWILRVHDFHGSHGAWLL